MENEERYISCPGTFVQAARQTVIHRVQSRRPGSEYANCFGCITLVFEGRNTHAKVILQSQIRRFPVTAPDYRVHQTC